MVNLKIISPTDLEDSFACTPWAVSTELDVNELLCKVQEITGIKQSRLRMWWWDGVAYIPLKNDADVRIALKTAVDPAECRESLRIYVAADRRKPEGLYGSIPYDCETPSLEKAKRVKRPSRSSFMPPSVHETVLPPSQKSELNRTTQGLYSGSVGQRATNGVMSSVANFQSPSNGVQQPNSARADSGLEAAVEKLRTMGFDQDEEMLRYYITLTHGNLNEILDLMQPTASSR
ncbi:unnamed protein product [Calicophoron daubneyi]|uniref:UBA domain-containing protein n=1 Tax=Calicophoron daubneyi TaxID=300641 RepID=A0AAV2TJT0_CALDB